MLDVIARPSTRPDSYRRSVVLGAATLLAVAACSAGATPPSREPAGSGSASPAIGSHSPSPTGAASSPSATASGGAIEHPTDSDALVLRMTTGGGFVPIGFAATESPQFSAYGDGTVIYRPSGAAPPMGGSGTYPPYEKATLTPEELDQLLRFALGPGGLAEADEQYNHPLVADAQTTTFEVHAGGVDKTVAVYALGLEIDDPAQQAARREFGRLAEALNAFDAEVDRGTGTPAGEYEPHAWRAVLIEDESEGERRDWPWEDISPSDFEQRETVPFPSVVITPEQARALVDEPAGGHLGVMVTGPDGAPYTIALRPLLPDEVE